MSEKKLPVSKTVFDLDDCTMKSNTVPGFEEWYENQYCLVVGEIDGHDFLLSQSLVVHKGPEDGGYHLAKDGVESTIHFFMLPQETRGQITNNDFITGGEAPWEMYDGKDLIVDKQDEQVVWSLGGKDFIARPPYFEVRGENRGVDVDLKMHSICPGFPYLGSFKDFSQTKTAGIDEYTQAEGTITVNGKKHEIANAGGLYEHVCLPGWDDIGVNVNGGYLWMVGWSQDIQLFLFYMPGMNNYSAHVIVDGKAISFAGSEQVFVHELDRWSDPKSKMVVGCKWLVRLNSDEGELDVVITSGGRSFNFNAHSNGYLCRYFNLTTVNGNFKANGKTIPIEDVRMCVDQTFVCNTLI